MNRYPRSAGCTLPTAEGAARISASSSSKGLELAPMPRFLEGGENEFLVNLDG